jgi:hypothetical protein
MGGCEHGALGFYACARVTVGVMRAAPATPEPETLAGELTCTACRRRSFPGERWSLRFADLGEVAIYCPECDEREFGAAE